MTRLVLGIAFAASVSVLARQTPRDATIAPTAATLTASATISGTIVADDTSSQPLRRVVVTISGGDLTGSRLAVTDDKGHFTFPRLSAGHYSLSASKPGWITTYYGSKHPGRAAFGGA